MRERTLRGAREQVVDMAQEASMCVFCGDMLQVDQVKLQHIEPSSLEKRQVATALSKATQTAPQRASLAHPMRALDPTTPKPTCWHFP